MGIFDKAKDLLNQHNDRVDEGLDKAGDFADEKTGGTYGDHIEGAVDQVQGRLDEFSGHDPAAAGEPTDEDPLAPNTPPAGA